MSSDTESAALAERIAAAAVDGNVSVAAAESLTGGLIASRLAAAPEASNWFRGAIVAYSREVKYDLLGVPVGPDDQDGEPPGTVWVAVYGTGQTTATLLRLAGDPARICQDATFECMRLLLQHMPPARR